jgi:DUF1009 family protein
MAMPDSQSQGPLGIISGAGSLPFAIADSVIAAGRPVVLFGLEGSADPGRIGAYRHHWVGATQPGKLINLLRKEGCRDVVFIGGLRRPPWWKIRFGWRTLVMLPRMISLFRGGDDHLLTGVARIGEQYGFRIVAAHEVAPQILIAEGNLTAKTPTLADQHDIAAGFDLLRAIGPFDVGQAAVVSGRHILAIEGPEGTDAMLARVAELRESGVIRSPRGAGVLVKAPKPQQDRRVDLPAIGPKTIETVRAAGLGGIAVIAGETILAEPERVTLAAEQADIFVTAVRAR